MGEIYIIYFLLTNFRKSCQLSSAKINTVNVSSTTIRVIKIGFILHSKNLGQRSTDDLHILYCLLVIPIQKEKETLY